MMEPQEDPHDTTYQLLLTEYRDHRRHVRHEEFHPNTCRLCRNEIDMVRG